jgi:predicted alpha-1,2-mannosidase
MRSILLFLSILQFNLLFAQNKLPLHVNPFIGTGGHGHTYPGVCAPFGMVQLSPDTRLEGWDGCSGYHYSDNVVYGFSHTHLSGTGVPDYGDILIMPTTGEIRLNNGADGSLGYRSAFLKSKEKATYSKYETFLEDYGINVSLQAGQRSGFHQYQFPKGKNKNIILDLKHRDPLIDAYFQQTDDKTVVGYRFSKDWAKYQKCFFYITFSLPVKLEKTIAEDGKNIVGGFKVLGNVTTLNVNVGISNVDIKGAAKNLAADLKNKSFAEKEWNKLLSSIEVESNNYDDKVNFYTALYHLYQVPNLIQDVDNQYLGMDLKAHLAKDHNHYTVFSLWDTYRAAHPLYTILQPQKVNEFLRTFLDDFEKSGALPMWPLAANETWCMIGNHAIPVIADAYFKGLIQDNKLAEKLLNAMIKSTEIDHFGQHEYAKYGFVPAELEHESVSKTVEYAYDDYCIAMMAKAMKKEEIYAKFIKRAQQYKNVFNPANGFSQAKINNAWVTPFRPDEVNSHFTEGNSWHYSFSAPHDMKGWINLHGGVKNAEAKLDALFSAESQTSGRDQADLTGFIGQYVQGNEPSHHIAYLYNFVGKPQKTQALMHKIMTEFYKNQPDGLIGNEDCGQMSAWYIFSAMGFYPVNPCGGQYVFGTPHFQSITLKLDDNKTFKIKALGLSSDNFYIQSVTLNGKPLNNSWLSHDDIIKGGELVFTMGNTPSNWATAAENCPTSEIQDNIIIPLPFVAKGEKSFLDKTSVELGCASKSATIYYQINQKSVQTYQQPIVIHENSNIKFWVKDNQTNKNTDTLFSDFFKIPVHRSIKLINKYAPQYAAGGENALIDFLKGGKNYHVGSWQGYEGVDCEAIIDLQQQQNIKQIKVGVLQDQNAWIFAPTEIQTFISNDGITFTPFQTEAVNIDEKAEGTIIKDVIINKLGNTRYLKVIAKNRGFCPDWHKGAAWKGKAWIFLDEVGIE